MSNENKKPQQQHPPDPRTAEAQIYQRIETARAQLYTMVNSVIKDTGLPTAIILELLRGVVAETSLMLERAGRAEKEAAVKEAVEGVREAAKEQGDKDK